MQTYKTQITTKIALLATLATAILIGCNQSTDRRSQKAKYVFYFIGDGMGLSHISLTETFLAATTDGDYSQPRLNMTQMKHIGLTRTHCKTRLITESAAAGTALATGAKTSVSSIGMTSDKEKPLYSIAHSAKKAGFKVGIISSVPINHATPAAFYAHVPERKQYYDIGLQIANSGFDFFGGGGITEPKGKNNDQTPIDELLTNGGYTIINSNNDYLNINKLNEKTIFSNQNLAADYSMQYAINNKPSDLTLAQTVKKAIDLLDNNEKGFFMMVEGGKIDWANHANDAASSIYEIIDFDNAIGEAIDFYKKNPDNTLIVICADHETGGLSLGNGKYKYESNPAILKHQKLSVDSLTMVLKNYKAVKQQNVKYSEIADTLKKYVGLGNSDIALTQDDNIELENYFNQTMKIDTNNNDDKINKLAAKAITILATKAGIAWTTGVHTWQPTLVFAHGCNAHEFTGYIDNIDPAWKLAKVMQIEHNNTEQ